MEETRLGAIEARFAELVWANAPLTTAELIALCQQDLNWKRTTTYTVLKRLSERGLFQNDNGTVTVKLTKEEFYARRSAKFVEENFQGSLPAFFAAFTAKQRLSPEEIAEIRRMIDSYGEGEK